MQESKRTLKMLGIELEVVDVPITSAKEYFNEYELADGTILHAKGVATSVVRVDGQKLPDGRPVYFVTMNPSVDVKKWNEG
jgi:hypothetical protein